MAPTAVSVVPATSKNATNGDIPAARSVLAFGPAAMMMPPPPPEDELEPPLDELPPDDELPPEDELPLLDPPELLPDEDPDDDPLELPELPPELEPPPDDDPPLELLAPPANSAIGIFADVSTTRMPKNNRHTSSVRHAITRTLLSVMYRHTSR